MELWSNVRLVRFDDQWTMMDTVGNSQVQVPDFEAVFFTEAYSPSEVEQFLRIATMYFLEDAEFESREGLKDENGVNWKFSIQLDSLCDPPRQIIRLTPEDQRELPEGL